MRPGDGASPRRQTWKRKRHARRRRRRLLPRGQLRLLQPLQATSLQTEVTRCRLLAVGHHAYRYPSSPTSASRPVNPSSKNPPAVGLHIPQGPRLDLHPSPNAANHITELITPIGGWEEDLRLALQQQVPLDQHRFACSLGFNKLVYKKLQPSLPPAGAKSCPAAEGGARPQVNLRPPPALDSSSTDPPLACTMIGTLIVFSFAIFIAGLVAKLLMLSDNCGEASDSSSISSDLAGLSSTCLFTRLEESSLVPAGFVTAQFLHILQI